jgi:hypothetical protein|tara:strand:+ start:2397 stop:2723 length:327 start_codon:yes stop_codon:yes gene_type:complete
MSSFDNPTDPRVEDLITRTQVGRTTQEFIKTPTGKAIIERAVANYRKAIIDLQEMSFQEWTGSSEEELKQYRKISSELATPLKLLNWLDAIISDGENAEQLAKYREAG